MNVYASATSLHFPTVGITKFSKCVIKDYFPTIVCVNLLLNQFELLYQKVKLHKYIYHLGEFTFF